MWSFERGRQQVRPRYPVEQNRPAQRTRRAEPVGNRRVAAACRQERDLRRTHRDHPTWPAAAVPWADASRSTPASAPRAGSSRAPASVAACSELPVWSSRSMVTSPGHLAPHQIPQRQLIGVGNARTPSSHAGTSNSLGRTSAATPTSQLTTALTTKGTHRPGKSDTGRPPSSRSLVAPVRSAAAPVAFQVRCACTGRAPGRGGATDVEPRRNPNRTQPATVRAQPLPRTPRVDDRSHALRTVAGDRRPDRRHRLQCGDAAGGVPHVVSAVYPPHELAVVGEDAPRGRAHGGSLSAPARVSTPGTSRKRSSSPASLGPTRSRT